MLKKKPNKNWLTLIIATLLLLIGIALPHSPAEATAASDGPEDVVEAVKADRAVQSEISRVRNSIKAKGTQEEINVIGLGGVCGVAGCSNSYLVIITVHKIGVNPQSASVLAKVHTSPGGRPGEVSVVELKEKGRKETKREVQRQYSSSLPLIKRK